MSKVGPPLPTKLAFLRDVFTHGTDNNPPSYADDRQLFIDEKQNNFGAGKDVFPSVFFMSMAALFLEASAYLNWNGRDLQAKFHPAEKAEDVNYLPPSHPLAKFVNREIDNLTPKPPVVWTKFTGNGEYTAQDGMKIPVDVEKYNVDLSNDFQSITLTGEVFGWFGGVIGTIGVGWSVYTVLNMRRSEKKMNELYTKYIDPTKIQTLTPNR